jgi:YD repeat-containing protein
MRRALPLVVLAACAGCATAPPSLYDQQPILPASMCLTLLVRDGLGLPTVKANHQPAAVKVALPRRLERLTQIDLLRLGLPPGTFLDAARLTPYSASSGALMPLRSSQADAHLHPGQVNDPHEQKLLNELSDLLSRQYAEAMGASAFLGQGVTVSPVVNTFSGNLFVCSLDAVALWKGLNVGAYRVYNGLQRKPGPFGPGWTHNFSARLDFNEDRSILYTRWDGSSFCYKPDGKEGYVSPEGFNDALTRSGTGWMLEDETGFHLLFDPSGRLTRVGNRLAYRLDLEYDGERLLTVRNMVTVIRVTPNQEKAEFVEGGPGVTFAYDEAGRIRQLRSSAGGQMDYAYDENGRLARVTWNTQQSVEYRYDLQGRLAEIRSPQITRTDAPVNVGVVYDDRDRVREVLDANGNPSMRFAYRWAEDRTTQIALGLQHTVVTDHYDPRGVLEERVETSDTVGNAQTVQGGGKRQRRATDDDLNVTLLERQDGSHSRWLYDDRGRMIRAQDSNGAWVELTYDPATGLPDYIREGTNGRWIRFTYHANREIAEVVLDDGNHYKVEYDTGGVPRNLIGRDGTLYPLSLGLPSEIPQQLWEF